MFTQRIQTRAGVWIFATVITCIATIMSNRLVFFLFPPEDYEFTASRAAFITIMIAGPICLYVGSKVRENTLLGVELARLVNRDRLTDVATRDFFFDRMEKDPDAYGISLMVDIDHFKRVNDTHGHFVGDKVIQKVSNVLRQETRPKDIVCRFGGEEFVIFLHEVNPDQGLLVAERMRMSVEKSLVKSGATTVSVTVSIGGALKEQLEDINLSIQQADAALYRAKESGRNRTVVDWIPSGLPEENSRAS